MTPNAKGALLALIAFALFAAHDTLIKSLGARYAPMQIVFFSVLLSFPLATVMLLRDQTRDTLIPHHPGWVVARTIVAVVVSVCAFYAFSKLPLTQVYAILFTMPLLITVFSVPILGEKVRARRWAAVIVGLAGVLIVLRPGRTDLELGHLAAMIAAVGAAFASVVLRRIGPEERSLVIMLYPLVANFMVMGAAMPFVYQPMPFNDLLALACIAALAWTASKLIIDAYKSGDAVVVAPMQYSQILWATLYGMMFFNEVPDALTAVGATVIIASGLFILFRESRASENRPNLNTKSRAGTPATPRVSSLTGLLDGERGRAGDGD